MKIAIVVGTRPEIIKMSPVILYCEQQAIPYFILHSGQHYSYNLDKVFFEQLELPQPLYNLDVGSGSQAVQIGRILQGMEPILMKEKPSVVLVEGDTNTVLAGALAAAKLQIPVGHVEAGLRSYDRSMPEEINRVLTDHCSDYLFAPTEKSRQILRGEGIPDQKVFVTGNTIVDAVVRNRLLAEKKTTILQELGVRPKQYFLATVHRQENVEKKTRFSEILSGLFQVQKKYGLPVLYPMHPHARRKMEEFGLSGEGITLLDPVDYLSFLQLEKNAQIVLTDSGGVQEEACILGIPCVTLRENTERPETLEVGANVLAGTDPERIVSCVASMVKVNKQWDNPFGSGIAGKQIIEILRKVLE